MAAPSFYVSVSACNNSRSLTNPKVLAEYRENRTEPFIRDGASEYEIAIARARLTGATRNLPLWQAPPLPLEDQLKIQSQDSSFVPSVNKLSLFVKLQYQTQGYTGLPSSGEATIFGHSLRISIYDQYGAFIMQPSSMVLPLGTYNLTSLVSALNTGFPGQNFPLTAAADPRTDRIILTCNIPNSKFVVDFDDPAWSEENKTLNAILFGGIPGQRLESEGSDPPTLVFPNSPFLNPSADSFFRSSPIFTSKVFLEYTPEDESQPPPPQILTDADQVPEYYWVYNYGTIFDMYNKALTKAYASIMEQVRDWYSSPTASLPWPVQSFAPYFEFDGASQRITISGPSASIALGVTGQQKSAGYLHPFWQESMRIGVDARTQLLMSGLPWTRDPDGSFYFSFDSPTFSTNEDGLGVISQQDEYICIDGWSPVSSICIGSQSGISTEYINAPYAQAGLIPTAPSSAVSDVITDIILGKAVTEGEISYIPSVLRYNRFASGGTVQSLHVAFSWRHVDGRIFPLYLEPQQSLDVKFHIRLIGYNSYVG